MNNDVILSIGAEAEDANKVVAETQAIFDKFTAEVERRFAELSGTDITPEIEGQILLESIDAVKQDIENAEPVKIPVEVDDDGVSRWQEGLAKIQSIQNKINTAQEVATKLTQFSVAAVDAATGAWSSLNEQIERRNKLLSQTDANEKDAFQGDIKRAEELGGIESVEKLDFLLKQADENLKNSIKKVGEAKRAFDDATSGLGSDGKLFGVDIRSGERDDLEQAEKENEKAVSRLRQLAKAREAAQKRATEEGKKNEERQQSLNEQLEREIKLREESALRSEGNDEEANALKIARIREDAEKRFAALGDKEAKRAADKIVAAEKEKMLAEQGAMAKKEAARDEKEAAREKLKAEQEAEKVSKDRERTEKKIADARQKIAESDEDTEVRRQRLQRRNQDARRRERRVNAGGVDSSIEAAISRIQGAASKPDDDREEARHQRLVEFEEDAKRKRDRQLKALEKIAGKPDPQPAGML